MPDEILNQEQQAPEVPQSPEPVAPEAPTIPIDADTLLEMQNFYFEAKRERELNELRKEWGDKFEETFKAVGDYLSKLDAKAQAVYNSVDGAKFLAWKLSQEPKETPVPDATPPGLDGSKAVPAGGNKFKFTQSEILRMPAHEYKAKQAEIGEAYRLGLVDKSH